MTRRLVFNLAIDLSVDGPSPLWTGGWEVLNPSLVSELVDLHGEDRSLRHTSTCTCKFNCTCTWFDGVVPDLITSKLQVRKNVVDHCMSANALRGWAYGVTLLIITKFETWLCNNYCDSHRGERWQDTSKWCNACDEVLWENPENENHKKDQYDSQLTGADAGQCISKSLRARRMQTSTQPEFFLFIFFILRRKHSLRVNESEDTEKQWRKDNIQCAWNFKQQLTAGVAKATGGRVAVMWIVC